MDKKGSTKIAFIILAIIIVSVAGYFVFIKKPEALPTAQKAPLTETANKEAPESINWKNLLPTIKSVIGSTFLGIRTGEHPMKIWQTSNITGDSVPEALVYLGQGGAYTDYLTLMRVENNKPVVAQFKQKDGKISSLMFVAGASAMNGESVTMIPEKRAIYAGHWSKDGTGGKLSSCKVEAYQWNPQTKIFDFSQNLSNEIKLGYCQKAGI